VSANLFRNVDNQLTNNKASHLRRTLNAADHPGWIWERLEAGMM